MFKKIALVFGFLLLATHFIFTEKGLSLPNQTYQLIQSIQFSSPPNVNMFHKAELYGLLPVEGYMSQDIILMLDGKIVDKVDREKYVTGKIMIGEMTNDNLDEVFFYQYSTGSGGAMGLHVYSLVDGVWKRIYTDPRVETDHDSDRFKNEYLENKHLRFYDELTGLSGIVDMSSFYFSEEQLKKMKFQTDTNCEYIIHQSNCIGNQIETVQWIFAFSHPTSVFAVHNFYVYQFDKKSFILNKTKIVDEKGEILAQKEYY